jgi:hypothetical protein
MVAIVAIVLALLGVATARAAEHDSGETETDAISAARASSATSTTTSTASTSTTTSTATSMAPTTTVETTVPPTTEAAAAIAIAPKPRPTHAHAEASETTDAPTEPAADAEPAPPPAPSANEPEPPAPSGTRCLVRLHGKGGSGRGTYVDNGVTVVSPSGNASGWGGRQWLYFAPSSYDAARAVVAQAVDDAGCGQVIIDGFSNGAAFATKLYCRGESFDGRLVRVVSDDPVPDAGANGCAPASGVSLTIYWTGALASTALPAWNCSEQDWTCEGGVTLGIDAYAASAGAAVKKSPYDDHRWYMDAPELDGWR